VGENVFVGEHAGYIVRGGNFDDLNENAALIFEKRGEFWKACVKWRT
jgi:hypothetical protein